MASTISSRTKKPCVRPSTYSLIWLVLMLTERRIGQLESEQSLEVLLLSTTPT